MSRRTDGDERRGQWRARAADQAHTLKAKPAKPAKKPPHGLQTSSTSTPARSAFAVAMIFDCRCDGTSS
jgi:hypothetical protein